MNELLISDGGVPADDLFRNRPKTIFDYEMGAIISPCEKFRYVLTRNWDATKPKIGFVMLNPSTADAYQDDATIRKCIKFARFNGGGGLIVTNLYAYRARDPKDLKAAGYLVGPDNDHHIDQMCKYASTVICAWGTNARGHDRATLVLGRIIRNGHRPKALALNDGGVPAHPLMLPYSSNLREFSFPC